MHRINSNPSVQCLPNVSPPAVILDQSRRTANYKPKTSSYIELPSIMHRINCNPSVQCLTNVSPPAVIVDQSRRTANYKPNFWNYDLLEALSTDKYADKEYERRFNELVEEVKGMFFNTAEALPNLELIDNIQELGLAYLFEHEIVEALDIIASNRNPSIEKDLYATALLFTLLRQHGYQVSQGT